MLQSPGKIAQMFERKTKDYEKHNVPLKDAPLELRKKLTTDLKLLRQWAEKTPEKDREQHREQFDQAKDRLEKNLKLFRQKFVKVKNVLTVSPYYKTILRMQILVENLDLLKLDSSELPSNEDIMALDQLSTDSVDGHPENEQDDTALNRDSLTKRQVTDTSELGKLKTLLGKLKVELSGLETKLKDEYDENPNKSAITSWYRLARYLLETAGHLIEAEKAPEAKEELEKAKKAIDEADNASRAKPTKDSKQASPGDDLKNRFGRLRLRIDTGKTHSTKGGEITQLEREINYLIAAGESSVGAVKLKLEALEQLLDVAAPPPAPLSKDSTDLLNRLHGEFLVGLPPDQAGEFGARFEDMLRATPEIEQHLLKTLGTTKPPEILFDSQITDAFYDGNSNTIKLPKGKSLSYVLDGLLFECCNVENKHLFDELDKVFVAKFSRKGGEMSMREYGSMKAGLETKTVLKHVQLVHGLKKAGKPLDRQAQANLDAVTEQVKAHLGGKTYPSDDAMMDDFFSDLDGKHKDTQAAVLKAMSETPHNKNAKDPTDTRQLKSNEMYAFERIGKASATLVDGFLNILMKAFDAKYPKNPGRSTFIAWARQFKQWAQTQIDSLELDKQDGVMVESWAAAQVLVSVQEKAARILTPPLDIDFKSLEMSPDMKKLAEARFNKLKERFPTEYANAVANLTDFTDPPPFPTK